MRYLLDTDHASYLQRGHPAVVQHLKSLPPDAEVFISVVTQAELLTGIQLAPSVQRRIELRRLYDWLVSEISDPLPITPDTDGLQVRIGRNLSKAIERNEAGDEGHGAREKLGGRGSCRAEFIGKS